MDPNNNEASGAFRVAFFANIFGTAALTALLIAKYYVGTPLDLPGPMKIISGAITFAVIFSITSLPIYAMGAVIHIAKHFPLEN